jgi:Domain of unknown function (DUF4192)
MNIGTAPKGTQNGLQARLIGLSAMLPDSHAAPVLTLLASFTWRRGDGAMARVALARALRCDPDYRLALLLQQMVDLAIRPGHKPISPKQLVRCRRSGPFLSPGPNVIGPTGLMTPALGLNHYEGERR